MAEDPREQAKGEAAITTAIALLSVYGAARAEIMGRVARGVRRGLLLDHWRPRVATTNEKALKRIAAEAARAVSDRVSLRRMDAWLEEGAQVRADVWADELRAVLADIDAQAEDFDRRAQEAADAMVAGATDAARDIAASAVEFGNLEGEKANGKTTKTWQLGPSDGHRPSHLALDGVTVGIDERFPNGLRFPRAPGPPAEVVNCNCYLTFGG